MLDCDGGSNERDGADQRPANPRRFKPPVETPEGQHRAEQPNSREQQRNGHKVRPLERFLPFARRKRQSDHRGQGQQRQSKLEHISDPPVAPFEQ